MHFEHHGLLIFPRKFKIGPIHLKCTLPLWKIYHTPSTEGVLIQIEWHKSKLRGVWTQIFSKHIESCNFQTIIVMYIKVYISGMEMSQRIHFWYQILQKMLIFWENGKKPHFWQNIFCDKLKKNNFEIKMLKLPEYHVFFENFDQQVKKRDFLPKNHFFGIFWHVLVKIFKIIAQFKNLKKKKNRS